MSDTKIWYFIKFFEKEEYADQLIDGWLYLNRLGVFRQNENNCTDGRSDTTEAIAHWWQPHDYIMHLNIPGVGSTTITKDDLAGPVYTSYSDHDFLHVYCLYAIHTTGFDTFHTIDGKLEIDESKAAELQKQLAIDDRCLKFGSFAVIIRAVPFLSQVEASLQRMGLSYRGKIVEYYDDETFHGEIAPNDENDIPFRKQKRFSYQKEYRICVQTNTTGCDALKIYIGDTLHTCARVASSQVKDLLKLKPQPTQI
jgi:hypothetical protein